KGQHPDEDDKNGKYHTLRNQPLRKVASLMLDEADFLNQDNYGTRTPSIFASNVAKLLYEMLSPSFNDKCANTGNEADYPFKIPSHAGMLFEKSLEVSKADAAKALVTVVRDLSIMLQKNLDESWIKEMENIFEKWFVFLDRAVAAKKLSKTVYRINMHLLSHVGEYIRFLGPMPFTIGRSMK
ncbi:hypothetical protein A0J61_11781, partial [Choanephora cucurbitarum]